MLMALITCQAVGIDGKMSAAKLNSFREDRTMCLVGGAEEAGPGRLCRGHYWELQVFFPHMIKADHLFFVKCLRKQLPSKRAEEKQVW